MSDRPCILAVDDRPANLRALQTCLARLDVEVVLATSGPQALEASLDSDFALALLDVQMPGMDGYELAGLLRGDQGTRKLPIIFLTAFSDTNEHVTRGYAEGAVDYLVKPYDPDILIAKVRVFLELDHARREIQRERDRLEARVAERTADLKMLNSELLRSNLDLEHFAYAASHDLKEPARMIALFTERLALRFQGQDAAADSDMAKVIESARHLTGLLDDLQHISSLGLVDQKRERIHCADLIGELLEEFSADIAEVSAEITVGELPELWANPRDLSEAFRQLISNALKFRGHEPTRLKILSRLQGALWELSFSDNGIGIAPDFQERIFTVFKRLHRRQDYPGRGTGLAIVKKVALRHGGDVTVESTPGQGACFRLMWPVEPLQWGHSK